MGMKKKNVSAKEMKQYKESLVNEYFNNLEVMIKNKPIFDALQKETDFKKRDYENQVKGKMLNKQLLSLKLKNPEMFLDCKEAWKLAKFKEWHNDKLKQEFDRCDLDQEVMMMQKNAFEAMMGEKENQITKQNEIIKARTKELEDAFTRWGKPELVINPKSKELKSKIKELWGDIEL